MCLTLKTRNFTPCSLSQPKWIFRPYANCGNQLRFAFNDIFRILQYNMDVQVGECISSIVKEGQGDVLVGSEGLGGV
jgi:hypothetical protein